MAQTDGHVPGAPSDPRKWCPPLSKNGQIKANQLLQMAASQRVCLTRGREVVSEKTQHRLVQWSRGTRNYLSFTAYRFLHIFHSGFSSRTVRLAPRFIFLVSQLCKSGLAYRRCNTQSRGDCSEFIRLIFYWRWRKNRKEIPSLRVFLGCHTITHKSMFPSCPGPCWFPLFYVCVCV